MAVQQAAEIVVVERQCNSCDGAPCLGYMLMRKLKSVRCFKNNDYCSHFIKNEIGGMKNLRICEFMWEEICAIKRTGSLLE